MFFFLIFPKKKRKSPETFHTFSLSLQFPDDLAQGKILGFLKYQKQKTGSEMSYRRFVWPGVAKARGPMAVYDEYLYVTAMITEMASAVSLLPVTCPDAWSAVATSVESSSSAQVVCYSPYVKSHHNISSKLIDVTIQKLCFDEFNLFSTGVEGDYILMVKSQDIS